jgi:hypothetical protein
MVVRRTGNRPENDCAGEDQQQLQMRDPSSLQGGFYIRTITASVQLKNKITGCGSQEACHQNELIGGKPLVVKYSDSH